MVCDQCGAGLTPEMVKAGSCGFCGTAVAGVAHAQMEEHVDSRVARAEAALRRELKDELKDREPSAITVAAAEAGRYTAAKVWGCGAGCLSTIGSMIMVLLIAGAGAGPAIYQAWVDAWDKPPVEEPKPVQPNHPRPHPKKKRNKRRR